MTALQFWNKYKFWIIGAIIALIVIPPIYRLLVSAIEGDGDSGGSGTPGPPLPGGFKCNISGANRDKVISQGVTKSNEVCYLQTWLNSYYGANLKVDGNFGPATRSALDKAKPGSGLTFTLNTLGV